MARFCQYPFCPQFTVPLRRNERKLHEHPCKKLNKLADDRERARENYQRPPCLHCGRKRELVWSVGPDAAAVGYSGGYLNHEAVICSPECFTAWYDDHPEVDKPAAYRRIRDRVEDFQPRYTRIREVLCGNVDDVLAAAYAAPD